MPDPTRLLFGPYRTPRTRIGKKLFCEKRRWVEVRRMSDGPIPCGDRFQVYSLPPSGQTGLPGNACQPKHCAQAGGGNQGIATAEEGGNDSVGWLSGAIKIARPL